MYSTSLLTHPPSLLPFQETDLSSKAQALLPREKQVPTRPFPWKNKPSYTHRDSLVFFTLEPKVTECVKVHRCENESRQTNYVLGTVNLVGFKLKARDPSRSSNCFSKTRVHLVVKILKMYSNLVKIPNQTMKPFQKQKQHTEKRVFHGDYRPP